MILDVTMEEQMLIIGALNRVKHEAQAEKAKWTGDDTASIESRGNAQAIIDECTALLAKIEGTAS